MIDAPSLIDASPPALAFAAVDLDRLATPVLHGIDWQVRPGERWIVLGPNGSGKTTLFELASGYLHPTRGTVDILGRRLGHVDVRRLREHIGLVSTAVAKKLVPAITATDVVVSALHGALEPWWHRYRRNRTGPGPWPAVGRRIRVHRRPTLRGAVRRGAPAGAPGPGAHERAGAVVAGRTGRRTRRRRPGAPGGHLEPPGPRPGCSSDRHDHPSRGGNPQSDSPTSCCCGRGGWWRRARSTRP